MSERTHEAIRQLRGVSVTSGADRSVFLDRVTPHCRRLLATLPLQKRQIVQDLMQSSVPKTVQQVAEDLFIDQRVCSRQLGLLRQWGVLSRVKDGRTSQYDVTIPILKEWYRFTRPPGRRGRSG